MIKHYFSQRFRFSLITIFALFFGASLHAQETYVIGKKDSLFSKILGETRSVWVSIPEGRAAAKYPVIYLLDGEVHFHSFTGIAKSLGDESAASLMPDAIVVGIINSDRNFDYMPTRDSTLDMKSGGGPQFTRFLETELIPYISAKYPVSSHRTLVGHSLGGLLALDILLKHPALFKSYVLLDPALHWDNQRLLKESNAQLAKNRFEGTSLALAIAHPIPAAMDSAAAARDSTNNSIGFRSAMRLKAALEAAPQNGLRWMAKYYPEESHGTIPLPGSYDALKHLFSFYKRPTFAVLTAESASILARHYQKVSGVLGYTILPPANLVSGLCWRFRLDKRYADGLAFLETLRTAYLDYGLVSRETGLMYEEMGDSKRAAAFYAKAKKQDGE